MLKLTRNDAQATLELRDVRFDEIYVGSPFQLLRRRGTPCLKSMLGYKMHVKSVLLQD